MKKIDSVLVVDDELVMCNLLSDVLKDKGYKVDYTQNAIEGLKAITKGHYDVIIIDLKLPGMDGIELLREVKLKEDPSAVAIVITGHASLESAQHALRLGAYDYITKPFEISKICFTIRRAMAHRKLINANKDLVGQLQKERNELEHKVNERVREAEFIYNLGREISLSLDLEKIAQIIVESLSIELNLEKCAILLLDDATEELSIKFAQGIDKKDIEKTRLKKGEKISGWALEQKEIVHLENINSDIRFAKRTKERYYYHSLVCIPLMVKGKAIGVINLNNKKSKEKFTDSDIHLLKEVTAEISLNIENAKLYNSLQKLYISTVKALTSAIDSKDSYTKAHSEHVTDYAMAIAEEIGLSSSQIEIIREASQLHDLGKIGIHDYILTKSGKLTPREWEEVKLHALKGAELIKPWGVIKKGVLELIKQHHERYDGRGYPYGYKKNEVELGARIMAVADAYDAMLSERPYRAAYSKEEALKELKANSGSQFDPRVIKAFLKLLNK